MAALAKLDLSQQVFTENVFNKPPVPSRPVSGKFHNRGSGKLFPSTAHNKLFQETTLNPIHSRNDQAEGSALVVHPSFVTETNTSQTSTPRSVPSHQRRTQSAKAKASSAKEQRNILKTRPKSAANVRTKASDTDLKKPSVIDITNEIMPDLFDIERDKMLALPEPRASNIENKLPMYFHKQNSFFYEHVCEKDTCCSCKTDKLSKLQQNTLKPSVYGLEKQRQVYGSAPDISKLNVEENQFPYKMNGLSTSEVKEKESTCICRSSIPDTLEPLLPWLREDVPEEIIGVSPSQCIVFLSPTDWDDLPEVPETVEIYEDLPYIKDVSTPRKWSPKKYGHPFNKQPVEEWVCKHKVYIPEDGLTPQKLNTIYRQTIRLPRMRTAEVVRKEITELEDVLKGIGNRDSNCGIVQYQEEITHFKDLLHVTLSMIPERLKKVPEEEDMFGIRKMCEDHDLIIKNIKERVRECRRELAELELEAGIQTDRQYFRKRSNSLS